MAIVSHCKDPYVRERLLRALTAEFKMSFSASGDEVLAHGAGDSINVDRIRRFCKGFLANNASST